MQFDFEKIAQSVAFLLPVVQANQAGALIMLGFAICVCVTVCVLKK